MLYIGIDTGRDTGFAVWDSSRSKFLQIETMRIHRVMETVLMWCDVCGKDNVNVVFEDARQRKYLPQEKDMAEYRGKLMGAGSVKRDATVWQDFLSDKGVAFEMVAPRKGLTKWSAEAFQSVTGWKGQTNEHNRDAALLVFGR